MGLPKAGGGRSPRPLVHALPFPGQAHALGGEAHPEDGVPHQQGQRPSVQGRVASAGPAGAGGTGQGRVPWHGQLERGEGKQRWPSGRGWWLQLTPGRGPVPGLRGSGLRGRRRAAAPQDTRGWGPCMDLRGLGRWGTQRPRGQGPVRVTRQVPKGYCSLCALVISVPGTPGTGQPPRAPSHFTVEKSSLEVEVTPLCPRH